MEPLGVSVVDGARGHQPDPGVAVGVVVPVEERAAVSAGVLDGVEPGGELGPVLQGLEVRLRVGVVARGVRPAVRLGDAERVRVALLMLWSSCRSGCGWWPRRAICVTSSSCVLGWRTEDGETALICRLMRWELGDDPGAVDGSAGAAAVERPLGSVATPEAWRLLGERLAGAGRALSASGSSLR